MKTRLTSAAAADLADILRYLSEQSLPAARGFREKFKAVRQFIGMYPSAGRQTNDPNLRYVNTGNYPYLVFFEVWENQIVIMRVMHGARDPHAMPARPQ